MGHIKGQQPQQWLLPPISGGLVTPATPWRAMHLKPHLRGGRLTTMTCRPTVFGRLLRKGVTGLEPLTQSRGFWHRRELVRSLGRGEPV